MYFDLISVGCIIIGLILIFVGSRDKDFLLPCLSGVVLIIGGIWIATSASVYDISGIVCEKDTINERSVIVVNDEVYFIYSVKDYMGIEVGDNVTLNVKEINLFGDISKSATIVSPHSISCKNVTCNCTSV